MSSRKILSFLIFANMAVFCSAQTITIGSGSSSFNYPFHTYNCDSRTQVIYYASEINTSGYITSISFNMASSPSSAIPNVEIRFKQTSLTSYSANVFDIGGWTVVYSGSWPVGSGWVKVNFDCPYYYDGVNNLLVDVCINRDKYSSSNYNCVATYAGVPRSLCAALDDETTLAPQVWNTDYGYGPTAFTSTKVPNIKLTIEPKSHWQHIGIMTFNIKGGGNSESDPCNNYIDVPTGCVPRKDRIPVIIDSCSESFGADGPDIVGLQELNDSILTHGSSSLRDLINSLGGRYSWSGVSADGDVLDGGGYDGFFYKKDRFNCLGQGTFWLTDTPYEISTDPNSAHCRIASWVILHDVLTNQDYFVINTHLDNVGSIAREHGAEVIMEQLQLLAGDMPIILMGDMNSYELDNPYKIFTGQMYQSNIVLRDFYREVCPVQQTSESTGNGFWGRHIGSRIDFIFGRGDFVCKGATIERGRIYGRYPSDHYPVTVHLYTPTKLADLNCDGNIDISDIADFCNDWLLQGQELTNTTIDSGLLARWSFDSQINGVSLIDGKIEGAADFNGLSDAIEDSNNYSGGDKYSQSLSNWAIAFWFHPDRMPYYVTDDLPYYMMNIIGDKNKKAGSIQVCLRHINKIRLEIYGSDDGNRETAYNDTAFVTNKWYHVAIVYGVNPNQVKFYVDGVLDSTITLSNQTLCWIGPLTIGKFETSSRLFDGAIDELRIYNRQLSEDEIAYLAAGASGSGSVTSDISTMSNFIKSNDKSIINFLDFTEFMWFMQ